MKQLSNFITKEFHHVFRDRRTLLIMFGLPVAQILLFGFALTTEVKNAEVIIIDNARDASSQQLIHKMNSSGYFIIKESYDFNDVSRSFKNGEAKCAVIFNKGFGEDLLRGNGATVQIITDGSDPNTAKIILNYTSAIFNDYTKEMNTGNVPVMQIIPVARMLYNEEANGSMNFIPGVLALILMIVCTALTSVSIVREKEQGTMEVLLVSPFKPVLVLVAKAVPYLVLSLANFILILVLAVFVLHVPVRGSIFLLFFESMLFIVACLSLGLLISNTTNSQQTALLISMMGMMIPTMIFTGFIFPLDNMPRPFQVLSNIVPSRWYYLIVKSVMLKGLGLRYVWKETLVLLSMSVILLTIALKNFKTQLT